MQKNVEITLKPMRRECQVTAPRQWEAPRDFFFLYQTVIGYFLKYILSAYGVYIIYKKYIKNDKCFITIYTLVIFIFSTFISRNNYVLFIILKYYQYINLILFIFVPLIAFISFQIRYKNK